MFVFLGKNVSNQAGRVECGRCKRTGLAAVRVSIGGDRLSIHRQELVFRGGGGLPLPAAR
jgi:hypothetical protein